MVFSFRLLKTSNPKPETRNPKPETRNPKPETVLLLSIHVLFVN